jgi:hypothetical protein
MASPPAGSDRLTPLLHFTFNPEDFAASTSSGLTTIRNHGSLGATGNAEVSVNCTGTDTGPVADGRLGSAFAFDGGACHLRVPDPVAPVGGNHWTIMFWIKRKTVAAGQLVMFRGDDDAVWSAGETQIKFSQDPPPAGETADELVRAVCFFFRFFHLLCVNLLANPRSPPCKFLAMQSFSSHSLGYLQGTAGTTPLEADAWHHYAISSGGLPDGGRVLVDGVETASYDARSYPEFHHNVYDRLGVSYSVYLGGFTTAVLGSADRGLNGTLDDFRWYPYELTSAEIALIAGLNCNGTLPAPECSHDYGCSDACRVVATPDTASCAGAASAVLPGPATCGAAAPDNSTCSRLNATAPCVAGNVGAVGYDPVVDTGCGSGSGSGGGAVCHCVACNGTGTGSGSGGGTGWQLLLGSDAPGVYANRSVCGGWQGVVVMFFGFGFWFFFLLFVSLFTDPHIFINFSLE